MKRDDDFTRACPHCRGTGRLPKAKLDDPCPHPDVPGWTMRQCFAAKRCACEPGVLLGYCAEPAPALPLEEAAPAVSEGTEDEHGARTA